MIRLLTQLTEWFGRLSTLEREFKVMSDATATALAAIRADIVSMTTVVDALAAKIAAFNPVGLPPADQAALDELKATADAAASHAAGVAAANAAPTPTP